MLRVMLYYKGYAKVINLVPRIRQQEHLNFPLDKDELKLDFYCQLDQWRMIRPQGFSWADSVPDAQERQLADGMSILIERDAEKVGIYSAIIPDDCVALKKYSLFGEAGRGRATIGRGSENHIHSADQRMSLQHGEICEHNGEAVYKDIAKNGSFVNGVLVKAQSVKLNVGDEIQFPSGLQIIYLGNSVVAVGGIERKCIGLKEAGYTQMRMASPGKEGSVYRMLSRPPRFLPRIEERQYKLEAPPQKQTGAKQPLLLTLGPSLTMSVPMLMGSFLSGTSGYAKSGVIMMITSSALAVSWSLANNFYTRHKERRQYEDAMHDYIQRLANVETEISNGVKQIQSSMERYYPEPESVCQACEACDATIWERTPASEMFLSLRLGKGQVRLPYTIEVPALRMGEEPEGYAKAPYELKQRFDKLYNGPIITQLIKDSPVGLVSANPRQVLNSFLVQLAALHSPSDLKIAIIGADGHEEFWRSARALPHTQWETAGHMVACGYAACGELLSSLNETLTMRGDVEEGKTKNEPHYVVLFEDARYTRTHVLYSNIVKSNLGFSVIVCADDELSLPKECRKVLNCPEGRVYDYAGRTSNEVDIQTLTDAQAHSALAKLNTFKELRQAGSGDIPESVGFLETYQVSTLEQLDIGRRWTVNSTGDDLRILLGKRSPTSVFTLDISDKAHGPHGIVAGTTGSGKSVLLQTLLLSLAVNYSPEQMQFVMIDYKGGGSFNPFKDLPHSVGFIDNLQGKKNINRALYSIRGEVHRREELFKHYGVEDINRYIKEINPRPGAKKLGHILIVIDEFSELMDDLPDFMPELISTARVGRSVGLHMLLATQRPSNKVGPEIWSNSRYHICLRVQTREDSNDMLHRPDAAFIRGMGRGFVQVGNDELFEQIQTSYAGLPYDPAAKDPSAAARMLDELGRPLSAKSTRKAEQTQMSAIIREIMAASLKYGFAGPGPLWMPELPETLDMDKAPRPASGFPSALPVCIGVMDDVENQRYLPAIVDIAAARLLAVVGHAGCGKTTFIQTLTYALSHIYAPSQAQLFIMSFGGNMLLGLKSLPNVCDVLSSWDMREQRAVLALLEEELLRRDSAFASQQTDSFAAYNRALADEGKAPMPALIVVADRFAQWYELLNDAEQERMETLLMGAAGRGVYFVFTANTLKEIPSRMHASFTIIPMGMESAADYAEALGVSNRAINAQPPDTPGRGIIACNGLYEFQTGLAFGESTDKLRRARIEEYAKTLPICAGRALHITRVPAEFGTETLHTLKKGMVIPVGFEQTSLKPVCVDMFEKNIIVIGGKRQTGKSSVLRALAKLLAGENGTIFAVAPQREKALWEALTDRLLFMPAGMPATDQEDISSDVDDVIKEHIKLQKGSEDCNNPNRFRQIAETIPTLVMAFDDADSWYHETAFYFQLQAWIAKALTLGGKYNIVFALSFTLGSYTLPDNLHAFLDNAHIIVPGSTLSSFDPWGCALPTNRQNEFMKPGEGFYVPDNRFPVKLYLPEA